MVAPQTPYQTHYVYYEAGSAVQKANALLANLNSALKEGLIPPERFGPKVISLAQGAEVTNPVLPGVQRTFEVSFNGGYQKAKGGTPEQRANAADFLDDMLGMNFATAENTSIHLNNGRTELFFSLAQVNREYKNFVKKGFNIAASVGDLSWPMVKGLFKYTGYDDALMYQIGRNNMFTEVRNMYETHELDNFHKNKNLWAVHYSCLPNNPYGLNGNNEDVLKTQDFINAVNEWRKPRGIPLVTHIIDCPYYMCLPQRPSGDPGSILISPYEGINGRVIGIFSLAKSVTLATPGAYIKTVYAPDQNAESEDFMAHTTGFSGFPEARVQIDNMLKKSQHINLASHFNDDYQKYKRNLGPVEHYLGDTLLDHDEGPMVLTGYVPDDVIGRDTGWIDQHGNRILIETARDALAFAANFKGVVAVDQSEKGLSLVRYALPSEDIEEIEAGAKGMYDTFEYLRHCPTI